MMQSFENGRRYCTEHHKENQMLNFIRTNWILISLALAYCVLQVAYGRRSQIDSWCEARPKVAGVMKLLRAVLPDPWLLVQGLTLLVKGRLPLAYTQIAETIIKLLAGSALVLLTSCAALGIGQPTVATNRCFAYCLDVQVADETVAWCYGSQAEQIKALATLQAAGVKASVRK
jgi:hypothetical protein